MSDANTIATQIKEDEKTFFNNCEKADNWGQGITKSEKLALLATVKSQYKNLIILAAQVRELLKDNRDEKSKSYLVGLGASEELWDTYYFKVKAIVEAPPQPAPRPAPPDEQLVQMARELERLKLLVQQSQSNTQIEAMREMTRAMQMQSTPVKIPILEAAELESASAYYDYRARIDNYEKSNPWLSDAMKVQALKEASMHVPKAKQIMEAFDINVTTFSECLKQMDLRWKNERTLIFQSVSRLNNPPFEKQGGIEKLTILVDTFNAKQSILDKIASEMLTREALEDEPSHTQIRAKVADLMQTSALWINLPPEIKEEISVQLELKENDFPDATKTIDKLRTIINALASSNTKQ